MVCKAIKSKTIEGVELHVYVGDITEEDVDAIVVPANSKLIMGCGVAGAVKRKGGEEIEEEAMSRGPVKIGSAVETRAGRLRAKYVIHSPTMERPAGDTDLEKVYKATKAALELGHKLGIKSVSFPGMGTGVGGLNPYEAAKAMVKAIADSAAEGKAVRRVNLVAFNDELYMAFAKALEEKGFV